MQQRTVGKNMAQLAILAVCATVFLTALDQMVVVTALPQMITDLQIPVSQLDRAAWIISGYLLGYIIAMPLMGRVSDIYGRRRVLTICLSIFAFGSLLCGLVPLLSNTLDISFLQAFGIDVSSQGLIWLIAARFIQAAGGGAVVPVAMAVAGDFYGAERRAFTLGLIGMVTEAGGVLGPLYGSIIVQTLNWTYIFFLNLPLVALLLSLILLFVPANTVGPDLSWAGLTDQPAPHADKSAVPTINRDLQGLTGDFVPQHGQPSPQTDKSADAINLVPTGGGGNTAINGDGRDQSGPYVSGVFRKGDSARSVKHGSVKERIDIPGALLLGASLVCLSLGLSQEAAQITPSTTSPGTAPIQNNPWLIAAALVFFAAFIALELWIERRQKWPMIDLSLFKRTTFSAASITSLLVGSALIIAMADIPIFIVTVLNLSALDSGLALLRFTIMIPIGAVIGGWLAARITCRWTAILGLIPAAIGFWLMHLWPLNVDWLQITSSTLIGGLGFGLVIAPISTSAINAARARQFGMAAAIVTVLRMVGMILGLAALTSWGLGRFRALAAAFKAPPDVPALSAKYNELYGHYLINAAHDIYTAIFLAAGILCLVALLPALFLQGSEPRHPFIRSIDKNAHTPLVKETESEADIIHGQREK